MNYEDLNNQMLIALALDALSRIQSNKASDVYVQQQSAIIEAVLQELQNRK